jgi:hypothetical protein
MAKTYQVENTSFNPARPIGIMTGIAKGTPGRGHKLLATDGIPVVLSEKEYEACQDALKRYEAAGMVRVKAIGGEQAQEAVEAPEAPKKEKQKQKGQPEEVSDTLQALREVAKGLGIKGWHLMKEDKLEEAIQSRSAEKPAE